MLLSIGELGRSIEGATHVDLGPDHPTRVGLVLVDAPTDDQGRITSARVQPGFSHRGVEKLFEVRDFRQILMLADRHDWQSPIHGELGLALATEELLGLQVPERARAARTLLAEFSSITSHLAHLSWLGRRDNDATATELLSLRTIARELMFALSGNRVHPMLTRLGGIGVDPTPQWLAAVAEWAVHCRVLADNLQPALEGLGDQGCGVLGAGLVDELGLSGPAARAAGVAMDQRPGTEALAYAQLDWPAEREGLPTDGSAGARLAWLVQGLATSSELVGQAARLVDRTPGAVDTPLSKIIKVPDAETYLAIEGPWGHTGFHVVSRGERTPWRVRLRTPSFVNAQALQWALVGVLPEHVEMVVASLGWTIGDLDK